MIFKKEKHNNLYNILLSLSRNLFFYKIIKLPDTFETRIYLMFIHCSIFMIISKKKGLKFSQETYDYLFHNIEYNLRESGLGDVSVNKKMKELNKIFYDILLKLDLEKNNNTNFMLNKTLIINYFPSFKNKDNVELAKFNDYFTNFYNFCFEISFDNMIEECLKFKY